ncbi:hypothetical protein K9L63_03810 [Candidatus Gracilibacteria bacterium]|nr:hypothetical protein [Candidatus Gracilibacteria bacterium]
MIHLTSKGLDFVARHEKVLRITYNVLSINSKYEQKQNFSIIRRIKIAFLIRPTTAGRRGGEGSSLQGKFFVTPHMRDSSERR